MAQTIPLKVVIELTGSQASDSVSDSLQGVVHPWPGDPVILDITSPPTCLDPVWIGTNEEGDVAKYFPIDTPIADILLEGWAHVYQGTQICDSEGNANIYSDQYNHVLLAIAACCNNNFVSQALALKQSQFALTPGSTYPCGSEAIFIWLAVFGKNEVRPNLSVKFDIKLVTADLGTTLEGQISNLAFTQTTKLAVSWPNDFIGMTINGVNLVANDVVPMVGEMNVKDFDNGTVEIKTSILDEDFEVLEEQANTWVLPGTQCGANCIDPYPDPLTLPDGVEGVAYNATTQLEGDGPFALQIVQKPAWLTASLNAGTGLITWGGTPPTFEDNLVVEFKAENCGEPIVEETPSSGEILFNVARVLAFVSRTPAANQPWYKVVYASFLNLWVAISQQDGSGNQVMTSPDGEVWTVRSTPGDFNWNDICVNNADGELVAVATGDVGAVMKSTDGITWNAFNPAELGQWRGVIHSEELGLYVAVGSLGTNRIMTSPDGETWTAKTAPVLNNWYSITWSASLGLLVAVAITGTGNQIMTSPDGDVWTIRTSPGASRSWFKVLFADGILVAVAGSGAVSQRVMVSVDAINWALVSAANANGAWLGLAFGSDLWVAVANVGVNPENKAMKSLDATSWAEVAATPDQPWTSVAYDGIGRFVAVGNNAVMSADWP